MSETLARLTPALADREIVFRDRDRMLAAPFDPSTTSPQAPAVLFSKPAWPDAATTSYDVTADGSKFLIAKPENVSPTRNLVVVTNWPAELERKLTKRGN